MAEKKVLILNGSPRPGGNSSVLADQVCKGVEEAGGDGAEAGAVVGTAHRENKRL